MAAAKTATTAARTKPTRHIFSSRCHVQRDYMTPPSRSKTRCQPYPAGMRRPGEHCGLAVVTARAELVLLSDVRGLLVAGTRPPLARMHPMLPSIPRQRIHGSSCSDGHQLLGCLSELFLGQPCPPAPIVSSSIF